LHLSTEPRQSEFNKMKKIVIILILLSISIIGSAQLMKERRVYYLDCSYSMVQYGIWEKVRDNLKNAIDNVSDETTELMVIPFADNTSINPILKPICAYATPEGKAKLKLCIDKLPMSKSTMTYHRIPLSDFYYKRIANDRITYMFLMTDGQDEDKPSKAKKDFLPQWGKNFGDKNVFGFYVMLCNSAHDSEINNIIESQEHLWKVESADVNINLIRLQEKAVFNVRNEKFFDLPIYGDNKGKSFKVSFSSTCPYIVTKSECLGGYLRIWTKARDSKNLPVSSVNLLNVEMTGCGPFDFLVTDKIKVLCENKPERSLKIYVK